MRDQFLVAFQPGLRYDLQPLHRPLKSQLLVRYELLEVYGVLFAAGESVFGHQKLGVSADEGLDKGVAASPSMRNRVGGNGQLDRRLLGGGLGRSDALGSEEGFEGLSLEQVADEVRALAGRQAVRGSRATGVFGFLADVGVRGEVVPFGLRVFLSDGPLGVGGTGHHSLGLVLEGPREARSETLPSFVEVEVEGLVPGQAEARDGHRAVFGAVESRLNCLL